MRPAGRRLSAATAALALVAGTVVASWTGVVPIPPAAAAPGDVIAAGRVFADYDGDGVFDEGPDGVVDQGVNGVVVTVTDALGRSAATRSVRQQEFLLGTGGQPGGWAWTSEGDWSMTEAEFTAQTGAVPFVKAGEATAQLRVTFSDVPDGYESWFAGDVAQNGTSVQLVQAGDQDVDYAVLRPELYRQDPLDVITAVQSAGDPDPATPNFVDTPALVATDWSTSQSVHSFVDANGNGAYDEGEEFAPLDPDGDEYRYFQDTNGNGSWDDGEALSDVAFDDLNGDGRWDSGPWTNPTAYSQLAPAGPTVPAAPVTAASVRLLLPGNQECWAGPFTFDDRLVAPVTVPDDPTTSIDESATPRPVAYDETLQVNCWNFTGQLEVVFVPGGFWDGEPQYTAFPTTEQTTPEAPRTLAMFSEVGSVWGVAYEQTSNTAIVSAVYKRVSGLAEHQWGGDTDRALGGIYRIPDVMGAGTAKVDGDIGPSGDAVPWFSLADLGIDVGTVPSNAARGIGAATDPVSDPDGFAQAGKVGIGGIDTWTDGFTTYLFVMDLADQTLYRIDISPLAQDPTFVPTGADVVQIPLGLGDTERPWAVEVWHDEVYVGWTDTGDVPGVCATVASPAPPPAPGTVEPPEANLPDCVDYTPLTAHVAKVGLDGGTPVQVANYSLGYPRGNPIGNWGDQGDRYANENPQTRHWNTWTDQWTWAADGADADGWPDGSVGIDASVGTNWSTGQYLQVYPQAILSSLAFDRDGFLTMGLTDRTELQAGNIQWAADAQEPGGTSQDIYFEAVSSGEMLVAGWDFEADGYVLENQGYARGRFGEDNTYTQRWDATQLEHHTTGPGGIEFYDDDQALDASARGAGTLNHEEVALGAVLTVPGATDVATTAFDPLVNIRVQGLMWLTEDSGTPDRAVELTDDPGQASSPSASFQKGGGLGDLDALLPPPPIEIGNRVWFDADQDGHQSADEPGIGGVTVQLLDDTDAVIGTQVTQDDGTYYFSTRDDDPIDHYAPMEFGQDYTVRFVKPASGTLTVDLWGTTVTAPWSVVPFTAQQVEPVVALLNPHDPVADNADGVNERADLLPEELPPVPDPVADADRIDSNPAVDTGEYDFALGGPGQNEHSIDAGFVAYAPIDVLKIVDPAGAEPVPGMTFDIVLNATDFRGLSAGPTSPDPDAAFTFADLAALTQNAGLVTAADPDGIADGILTVAVGSDGSVPVARAWLPLGSTVQVSEVAQDGVEVVYDPTGAVLLDDGSATAVTTVRVTNTLTSGTFTVDKDVTGAAAANVPDGTTFPMEYSVDGGTTWVPFAIGYDADGDGVPAPFVSPELPIGTQVLVREALPAPPTGVVWGDVTIAGAGVAYDEATGVASFTVTESETSLDLTVTNTALDAPGGFQVAKEVTGDAAGDVPDDTVFDLEYSIDGGTTWLPLEVLADGTPVLVDDLPAGTQVMVREVDPLPVVPGVVWGTPMFSVGEGAPLPGPAVFVVEPGVTVSLVVTNLAEPEPGTFSVRKIVGGGAAGVVAEAQPTFTLEYAVDADPLVWVPLDIPWGQVAFPVGTFPAGTVVFIREAQPLPVVDGVEWGDPQLFVDGTSVPTDGTASITIRPGDQASPVISIVNLAGAAPGWFDVTKTVQGPTADLVPDGTTFTVEYSIDGGAPVQIEVPFGDTATIPDVPAGSTVTISEVALPDVPGVDWGTPLLTVDGVPQTGDPVTFTVVAGTGVAVGVVNTANEQPGNFTVTKTVVGEAAAGVPDGTEFVLEYSVDAGATWAGLTVPLGTLATSGELPAGTRVWVREGALPDVPGVVWGTPVIGGTGVTTDPDNGYATFVVGPGVTVTLTLENTADVAPGGFRAFKELSGTGTPDVSSDAEFALEYSTDGGDNWTPLPVSPDGSAAVVDGLPAGTAVLLRETPGRPGIPTVEWGDVTIGGVGVDYDPETGVASFTVGAGATVTITVTNTVTLLPGTFTLAKALAGDAAAQVPPGTEFTVRYTVDGGAPQTATLAVGETWTSPELPAGAEVTVTEVDLPQVDGVDWGEPLFRVDGGTAGPGPVTFTVDPGVDIAIEVTNTAGVTPGIFTVAKEVVGALAGTVPPGTTFVLEYSLDGGAMWLTLEVPLGAVVTSPPIPAGTEVLVREGAEPDVDGVVWGQRVLLVDGVPAPDGLGRFTVGAGTTVAIAMQDTADPVPPTTPPPTTPPPTQPPPTTPPTTPPTQPPPVPPTPTPELPMTGAEPGPLVGLAAALLGLGALLLTRTRRGAERRPAPRHAR